MKHRLRKSFKPSNCFLVMMMNEAAQVDLVMRGTHMVQWGILGGNLACKATIAIPVAASAESLGYITDLRNQLHMQGIRGKGQMNKVGIILQHNGQDWGIEGKGFLAC